jgi:PAS domain S-box-containing protein
MVRCVGEPEFTVKKRQPSVAGYRIEIVFHEGNQTAALWQPKAVSAMNLSIGLEGIWIIDAYASTQYANSTMCEILGVEASEVVGTSSFDYVFPEDMETARDLFETKQRGGANPFHFRLRRKDGSAVWVDVQGTPMHSVAGEFLGIVGTFRVSAEEFWKIEPRKSA